MVKACYENVAIRHYCYSRYKNLQIVLGFKKTGYSFYLLAQKMIFSLSPGARSSSTIPAANPDSAFLVGKASHT